MTDAKDKFTGLVKSFKVAMLATQSADGFIRARPMTIAEAEDDGSMWFLTSRNGWSKELEEDVPTVVTMQSPHRYVTVTGMAHLVDDRRRIHKLWNVGMQPWFPEGPESEDVCLVHFVSTEGEYWDSSGRNGLRYLFEAAKAVAEGRRVDSRDDREHASITT